MSNTYNDNLRHKFPIKANMIYDLFWRRGDNDFVRVHNIAEKTSTFKKYAKYQYIIEKLILIFFRQKKTVPIFSTCFVIIG